MISDFLWWERIEISPRFRRRLEEQMERLEQEANCDETRMGRLSDVDHLRRQRKLVTAQRAEALRIRQFLETVSTRFVEPQVAPVIAVRIRPAE
jgi:acyl-CoA reductase-like NAD-dependent aldehyde dehydrogenase